ncbi:uncharacterized protein CBL_14304 [Carabus blaptoides fortunei]
MNGYVDSITTNMENSRNCLRRIARHDETEFSNQSILNAMEKFVKSVNIMDETILVPCRLMDLKVGDAQDVTITEASQKKHGASKSKNSVKDTLNSADLFDLFNMLNTVKVDLLWGQNSGEHNSSTVDKPISTGNTLTMPVNAIIHNTSSNKGHVRRPSTVSMTSTNSVASVISDSESDTGNENDSGIEAEEPGEKRDPTHIVSQNFRRHLTGLYCSLQQLTEAANYLTTRYQHDVGSSV